MCFVFRRGGGMPEKNASRIAILYPVHSTPREALDEGVPAARHSAHWYISQLRATMFFSCLVELG